MDEALIRKAVEYVEGLFAGNADGHDAAHTLRVYKNAMAIADSEPGCDREIVALGALLHDADDHKLFDTKDNENAGRFLREQGMGADRAGHVIRVVNGVSFSRNGDRRPDTLEGRIVQDADRLDALGAVGIARTFAYGGRHGRSLEQSVAHFHEKLLLLAGRMNTEKGREMARKRHRLMLLFLEAYEEETDGAMKTSERGKDA